MTILNPTKMLAVSAFIYILPMTGFAQNDQIQRGTTAQGTGSTMDASGKNEADKMKDGKRPARSATDKKGEGQIQRGETAQGSGSTSPATDSNRDRGADKADKSMKGGRTSAGKGSSDKKGEAQLERGEAAQGSGSTSPSTDSNRGAAGKSDAITPIPTKKPN